MNGSAAASHASEGQVGLTREEWLTRNREMAPPLTDGQRALAVRSALMAAGVAESQIDMNKPEQIAGTGTGTGSGSDAEARRVEISLQ